eukprot:jgi/Chrzof1/539/Cz01g19150.t1
MATDPMQRLAECAREFGEYGGVNASVEVSTTFTVLKASTLPAIFSGECGPEKGACYVYGRSFNPTVRGLGRQLAALEQTEAGYACSSGMAAISSTLLALCETGDHIVASNTVYGGTHALLKAFLPHKCNITTTFVDITNYAAVEAAITDRTKVLYTEALSNPTLVVADLPKLAAMAHARGLTFVVDNTFTPMIITPSCWGADIVVHSMTKFISGASDVIAGAICGPARFIDKLMDFFDGPVMLLGPTMDPRMASELSHRLPHLGLRLQEHSRRAALLAARLEERGGKVVYPGLPSHPQHELMKQLMNPGYGFGGVMGVDMGTAEKGEALMERLQNRHGFGLMAVSLGYSDTLMSLSSLSTSSELSEEEKASASISDGYVRMSIGLTGTLEQRWTQLQEAFTSVSRLHGTAPYRATKMKRAPDGAMTVMESWPSLGPLEDEQLLSDDHEEEPAGISSDSSDEHAVFAVAPPSPGAVAPAAEDTRSHQRPSAASDRPRKALKLSDDMFIVYIPVNSDATPADSLATAAAAPTPADTAN